MNTTEQTKNPEHDRAGLKGDEAKSKARVRDLDVKKDPKAGKAGDPDEGGQFRKH